MWQRREFLRAFGKAVALAGVAAPWGERALAAAEPMGQKLRVGVIGTGARGRTLIENLAETSNCVVAAVCDSYAPHLERGRALVPASIPGFADHRRMLDRVALDAVVIATPLHVHAMQARDAFDAGLHVWCEKAMARTIADCSAMIEQARAARRVLQFGHQRLFSPTYLNAVARIRQGEIGPVAQVRASWHRNSSWRRDVPPGSDLERYLNWRLYRSSSAGVMTELACHQIQVANWVMDAVPQRVMGSGSICYWRDGREVYDHAALIYEYAGGRKLIYTSLLSNRRYGCEEQIMGSRGSIEPELGRIYREQAPAVPGLTQLDRDVRERRTRTIPVGGPTWYPELPIVEAGEPLGWGERDESTLQFEAFAQGCAAGRAQPGLLAHAYQASVAALLGEQAMDEGAALPWPTDLVSFADTD